MKKFKFNEQSAIENMMKVDFIDRNNITNTIYSLAKYNYHALGLSDKANYNHIVKYVTENCDFIYEESIYKDIEGCIRSAKKHAFVSINEVCITESELNTIRSLRDIKQEKAAFIILAASKYFNALSGKSYDSAFLTNADICQMARITIPVSERDKFMQFAYDKNILYRHTFSNSTIKKVTFVSHNDDDKIVLRLNENDFRDLAYAYLAYLTPRKYRKCIVCSGWMRKDSSGRQVCKECSEKEILEKDVLKTGFCIDCGQLFCVDIRNNTKCRCDLCQGKRDKELNLIASRERMRKYRERIGASYGYDSSNHTPENTKEKPIDNV